VNDIPSEFSFLRDPSLDLDLKKALLASMVEERRAVREEHNKGIETKFTRRLEERRFWHNTPLMLALVGTITIVANGLVSYLLAMRSTSDNVTIKELDERLDRQRTQLKTELAEKVASADAQRNATKDERDFEFRIIERELAKSDDPGRRAEVMLFLVRAKIITTLDREELTKIAEEQYRKATGNKISSVGIPPTLGKPDAPVFTDLGTVDPEKVMGLQERSYEGEPYTSILSDSGLRAVKEPVNIVLSRLKAGGAFKKFAAGSARVSTWVNPKFVTYIGPDPEADDDHVAISLGDIRMWIWEDAALDEFRSSPSFAKLTAPNGKFVWIKGAAVSRVEEANASWNGVGAHAVVNLNGRIQAVAEDAQTAKSKIRSSGGLIQ
jgi:hypothetical protein